MFQCPLCDVQSGRKDNILRHIRNLHSAEKFEEIIKKISKAVARVPVPDAMEQSVIVPNLNSKKKVDAVNTSNVCQYQSVIRFAGRSDTAIPERLEKSTTEWSEKPTLQCPEKPTLHCSEKASTPIQIVVDDEFSPQITAPMNVSSIDDGNNIHPERLNKELHVELAEPIDGGQTVNNVNIYRSLLSPYLRPPPNLDDINGAQEPAKRRGYQVQGDRLPKRKENVEIYRSILMSTDDQERHQTPVIQNNCADVVEKNVKSSNNPTSIVIHGQSTEYFSEMHWRKRTSQCFNRMKQ